MTVENTTKYLPGQGSSKIIGKSAFYKMPRIYILTENLQAIYKQTYAKTRIEKNVSVHSLRHSLPTHILESGIEQSSKTTKIYTNVSKARIAKIKNPLDNIMEEET